MKKGAQMLVEHVKVRRKRCVAFVREDAFVFVCLDALGFWLD